MHASILRLLCLCLLALLAPLAAQQAVPKDPFIKNKPGANPAVAPLNPPGPPPVVPILPEALPVHMLFTFETYILSQDALDSIHLGLPDTGQFYERVRKAVAEGNGKLDSVIALPTRSGQRALSESVDEVIYPTEWDGPVPGRNHSYPMAWETRATGHRVEVDPVLSPDERVVDINIAPEFTRLAGFKTAKADDKDPGALCPLFVTRKLTSAVTCPMDVPTLLGTSSAPRRTGLAEADSDGSVALTFATPRLSGPREAAPLGEPPPDSGVGNMRLVFRFYSLPRPTARDMLARYTDADNLHAQVRSLPATERILERIITVQTRSGQRSTTEEIGEWIYGTEADPSQPENVRDKDAPPPVPPPAPAEGATPQPVPGPAMIYANRQVLPANFTAFEMRPLGWSIEVDPVLGPDNRQVDLNLAPTYVEFRGNLEGHDLIKQLPQQPVFGLQRITTAVSTVTGRQCFLGTISAPHDTGVNGRKDDGRAWFAFVIVTLE